MSQNWLDDVFATDHIVETDMAQVENNFAALKSLFSGATEPATAVDFQLWANTSDSIIYIRGTDANWHGIFDCANDRVAAGKVDAVSIKTSGILASNLGATCVKAAAIDPLAISNTHLVDGAVSMQKLGVYTAGASFMLYQASSKAAPTGSTGAYTTCGSCVYVGPSGVITVELHTNVVAGGASGDGNGVQVLVNGVTACASWLVNRGTASTYIDITLPSSGNSIIQITHMRKSDCVGDVMQTQWAIRCGGGVMYPVAVTSTVKGAYAWVD